MYAKALLEVQNDSWSWRQFKIKDSSTSLTIARTRDKSEVDGSIQHFFKQSSGKACPSTNPNEALIETHISIFFSRFFRYLIVRLIVKSYTYIYIVYNFFYN